MILDILNLLSLMLLLFLLYKTIFQFQKFSNKTIFLYYILFPAIGFGALIITFILAFSGSLPNHYINEFDIKIINDISLFSGMVAILISVAGLITLLFKHLFFRTRNKN